MKQLVSRIQDEWLQHDDNINLWFGISEQRLDAKCRRILIIHWVVEVYKKLLREDYKPTRYRSFEKTGCLIIADRSQDSKINPESLDSYVVPPPLRTALAEQPQTCPVPEASLDEEELSFEEQPIFLIHEEREDNEMQENDERIDN